MLPRSSIWRRAQSTWPGTFLTRGSSRARASKKRLRLSRADKYVVTSPDGYLATFAATELAGLTDARIDVLQGGTHAWREARLPMCFGPERFTLPAEDVYKRPYEGTDNDFVAMQSYLDWEYGLVAQLDRDGTHGFRVI